MERSRIKQILLLIAVALAGVILAVVLRRGLESFRSNEPRAQSASTVDGVRMRDGMPTEPASEPGRRPITRLVPRKVAQDDPRAADYDALLLAQMTEVSNFDLFEREPRDEKWARGMEQALDDIVVDALAADFEGAEVASIECKTQSCVVSLAVDDERAKALHSYAQAYLLLGSSIEPSFGDLSDGTRTMQFAILYDNRFGDAAGYVAWRNHVVSGQESVRKEVRRELLGLEGIE